MDKVLIITGPTGVGKTKLSIEIAKKFNTEIINGDAYQVYRGMDILTAKIKEEEKQNIPHHLFDILDPTEEYSVATYQTNVRNLIGEFTKQNKLPLIVGGSGLYLDSVIYDYNFSSEKRNNETEEFYKNYSNQELHDELKKLDITASKKIHMNNRKRVLRAIELAKSGNIINEFNNKLLYDVKIIYLDDDRDVLYDVINKRVDIMVSEGLIDEVTRLSKMNLSITATGAIGYKELLPYIRNEVTLEEALDEVKKNSRHLAKRQGTWFRRKDNIDFIKIDRSNFNNTINQVTNIIKEWYYFS